MGIGKVLNKLRKGTLRFLGIYQIARKLKQWLIPKKKRPLQQGFETQQYGPGVKPPIPYGINNVPAIIVDRNTTDLPGGLKHEKLHVLAVFCYGVVQQIYEVYFDDLPSTHPKFAGKFTMEFKMGEINQTPIQSAVGNFNRFDAVHSNYPGMCVGYFTFTINPDDNTFNGEPEIKVKLLGRNCKDPRYGWQPKPNTTIANPVVCLIDYMTDPIAGGGKPLSKFDIESAIVEANVCDQLNLAKTRSISCGYDSNDNYTCTEGDWVEEYLPRFTLNLLVDTEQDVFQNVEEIASVFRAIWVNSDGRYKFTSERERTPVFELNESNLVNLTLNEGEIRDRLNRATVTYTDTRVNNIEREVVYPQINDPIYNTWLLEDNNLKLETTLQVRGITNPHEALQLAEIAVKTSRLSKTFTAVGQPICQMLDVGDVVTLKWPDFGYSAKTVRIEKITYNEDTSVNLVMKEHENAIYPWTTFEWDDIKGGSDLGDPNNPESPTGLVYKTDPTFNTRGSISWQASKSSFVRKYQVSVLKDGLEVTKTETVYNEYIFQLLDVGNYTVEVRSMTGIGAISQAASIGFSLVKPVPPQSIDSTIGNFEATVKPILSGIGLGTFFEFAIGNTEKIVGTGASFVYATLTPATEYTVFVRTRNALGVSNWASFIITTTSNGTAIVDLIGEDIANQVLPSVVAEVTSSLEQIVIDATINKVDRQEVQEIVDSSIAQVNDVAFEDPRINVVDAMQSILFDFAAKDKIDLVAFSVEQENQIRQMQVLELKAADSATLQRIDGVVVDVKGNATAISGVKGQVNNPVNGLTATFQLANEAKTTASGAVSSILSVEGVVNNPATGLTATRTLAQSAKQTADGATLSISEISGKLNNPITGLEATFNFVSQVKQTADGALASATAIANTINNPETGLSATSNLALQAKQTADGAVESIFVVGQNVNSLGQALTGTTSLAQSAKQTADGAVESISQTNADVKNLQTGVSSAANLAQSAKQTADGAVESITQTNNTVSDLNRGLIATTNTAQKALLEAEENDISANAVIGTVVRIMEENKNTVSVQQVNQALIKEGNLRAQQVVKLEAADRATIQQVFSVSTDLSKTSSVLMQLYGTVQNPSSGLAASFTLAQSAKTTADNAVSSISEIDGTIKNPSKGLAASYNLALQAKQTADGAVSTSSAISGVINNASTGLSATYNLALQAKQATDGLQESTTIIQNKVNNPETGLGAVGTIANQAKQTAQEAYSSATTINNQVNNPASGLNAVAQIASQAKSTADGNVQAITGLTSKIQLTDQNLSQATLALQTVQDETGLIKSRAFLGVTSVIEGVARINGIVIDGVTNSLDFRTNTLRLTDTDGGLKLSWSSLDNDWVYSGSLVAATFKTARSGYRAEMSGVGTIPFWYGAGEKTWANALFAVDTSGNLKISNAQVQGAFVSASSGNRVEINNDATYMIWAGSGEKTDANGIFWIKSNGTGFIKGDFFQGQIIENKYASSSATNAANLSATISDHNSSGKLIDVKVNGFLQCSAPGSQAGKTLRASVAVTHSSGTILFYERVVNGVYDSEFGRTEWYIDYPNFMSRTFAAGVNWFTLSVNYSFSVNPTGGLTVVNNSCSISTFENKLA